MQSSFSLQHELTLSTAKICHPVLILVQNIRQPKPAWLSGDQSGERKLCIWINWSLSRCFHQYYHCVHWSLWPLSHCPSMLLIIVTVLLHVNSQSHSSFWLKLAVNTSKKEIRGRLGIWGFGDPGRRPRGGSIEHYHCVHQCLWSISQWKCCFVIDAIRWSVHLNIAVFSRYWMISGLENVIEWSVDDYRDDVGFPDGFFIWILYDVNQMLLYEYYMM